MQDDLFGKQLRSPGDKWYCIAIIQRPFTGSHENMP